MQINRAKLWQRRTQFKPSHHRRLEHLHLLLLAPVALQCQLHGLGHFREGTALLRDPEVVGGTQVVQLLALLGARACVLRLCVDVVVDLNTIQTQVLKTRRPKLDDRNTQHRTTTVTQELTRTSCARAWYVHVWWKGVARSKLRSRITSSGRWKLHTATQCHVN